MKIFNDITDPQVVSAIKSGQIGVIRTDTVYGIVCSAAEQESVKKLYSLKNRKAKAGTIIAASIDQIERLGFKIPYKELVQNYWPGPYSIELTNSENFRYLSLGEKHQAVRIPDNKDILALLEKTGPLQTTSANQPGEITSKTMEEAKLIFGDKVDFYVDGGEVIDNMPSKIIRIVDGEIEYIRN